MGFVNSFRELLRPTCTKLQARVINDTQSTVVAELAEIADTPAARKRGLLRHDEFLPGQGLWIVPSSGVHTWGMKFDIDLVYLDRKRRVRKVRSDVKPWRMSMCLGAHSVLELPAGTVTRTATRPKDQLAFRFGEGKVKYGT